MADSSSSYRFIELRRRAFEQLPCAQGRALHGLDKEGGSASLRGGKRADDVVVLAEYWRTALDTDRKTDPVTRWVM